MRPSDFNTILTHLFLLITRTSAESSMNRPAMPIPKGRMPRTPALEHHRKKRPKSQTTIATLTAAASRQIPRTTTTVPGRSRRRWARRMWARRTSRRRGSRSWRRRRSCYWNRNLRGGDRKDWCRTHQSKRNSYETRLKPSRKRETKQMKRNSPVRKEKLNKLRQRHPRPKKKSKLSKRQQNQPKVQNQK